MKRPKSSAIAHSMIAAFVGSFVYFRTTNATKSPNRSALISFRTSEDETWTRTDYQHESRNHIEDFQSETGCESRRIGFERLFEYPIFRDREDGRNRVSESAVLHI